jgi:hypothetical protein
VVLKGGGEERSLLRVWIILGRDISCDNLLRAYVHCCSWSHMGMEGQETKRFLGARKPTRLLVGWEDNFVSLWESGKKLLEASSYYSLWTQLLKLLNMFYN